MKQFAFKGRLFLRKIFTVLSLGAVAVTFQACYGIPMVSLTGTVESEDGPIQGIQVSARDSYEQSLTDSKGNYRLLLEDTYWTIEFKDIDGTENGEFNDKEVLWRAGDGPLNVILERKQ